MTTTIQSALAFIPTMDSRIHPEIYLGDLQGLDFEELMVYVAHLPGTTAELVGNAIAEAEKKDAYRRRAFEQGKPQFVHEHLPRITMNMTPEQQAEAAVKYRELFVGDATAPPRVPRTSSRFVLVAAQVAARRELEDAISTPLPKGQARSVVSVNGFPRHSSTTPWNELEPSG